MANTANSYQHKSLKEKIKKGMVDGFDSKKNITGTLAATTTDLLVGVVAGGFTGAAIGKTSLLIGSILTGVGHYWGVRTISTFGMGMMAANGFQSKSLNGVDGFTISAAKERMLAYKENFSQKLFLDKILSKKVNSNNTATNGIGSLQYFSYPNDRMNQLDELNGELSALDNIEQQIEESGISQMQMRGMSFNENVEGIDGTGLSDVAEYNL
jgi:hypothetical protein